MAALSTLVLLALPLTSLCAPRPMAHDHSTLQSRATYTLKDHYQGKDFLEWDFFSDADPTHGNVNYLSKSEATSKGLAYVQDDNTTILAVDSTTEGVTTRDSVRISSPQSYNTGLFIADFWAMPHGPTTWPAWWTVGPNWPNGGEIDLIEGTGDSTTNQITLHTSAGCTLNTKVESLFSGKAVGTTNCLSGDGGNSGCGIEDAAPHAYGHAFNLIAGGVTAHIVNSTGIFVWRFPRTDIPEDITAQQPNPNNWGTPTAFFSSSTCNIADHFQDQVLTFDTTICGDLAGNTFPGGPSECTDAVKDASNYKNAQWKINYVSVYE